VVPLVLILVESPDKILDVKCTLTSDILTGAEDLVSELLQTIQNQPGGDAELGQLLRVHLVLGLLPDLLGQVADLCVVQSLHFDPPFEIILLDEDIGHLDSRYIPAVYLGTLSLPWRPAMTDTSLSFGSLDYHLHTLNIYL